MDGTAVAKTKFMKLPSFLLIVAHQVPNKYFEYVKIMFVVILLAHQPFKQKFLQITYHSSSMVVDCQLEMVKRLALIVGCSSYNLRV